MDAVNICVNNLHPVSAIESLSQERKLRRQLVAMAVGREEGKGRFRHFAGG